MNDVPDPVVLPCGCFITCDVVAGVRQLTYAPCSLSCVNYRNALDVAAAERRPVEYRPAP